MKLPKMSEHRLWGFDDEEREWLLGATALVPELAALVQRATPHKEIAGLWILWATGHELDELYSVIESVEHALRDRKQRELLRGMRMSLCSSIDAF